jgi:flagellar biogenesis protein FliO
MRIEMARWMDILPGARRYLIPLIILAALAYPSAVAGQTSENPAPLQEGAQESPPAEFGAVPGETLAGDVPSREDYFATQDENLPSYGIWNILVALVLVLAIFWVIFRFVVRPLMRGAVLGRGVEDFRIVASLPIAPTKSIQVVKMVDRLLVIGIAEGGMRLLTEIHDAQEASEMLKALDAQHPAKYHPFKKAFETMLSRKDETGFEDRQKKFNTTLDSLKEKIREMKVSVDKDE